MKSVELWNERIVIYKNIYYIISNKIKCFKYYLLLVKTTR